MSSATQLYPLSVKTHQVRLKAIEHYVGWKSLCSLCTSITDSDVFMSVAVYSYLKFTQTFTDLLLQQVTQ
jgi:hypothetical protein